MSTADSQEQADDAEQKEQKTEPPSCLQSRNLTARVLKQKVWRPANVSNDWFCFVIVGREGSGKSHTTLSILEKTDPRFSAEDVFFDPADLLEHIQEMPKEERIGKAVMLDESGVGMGVRTWHDKGQVKFNQTMQTARDDNMIIGLTLPRLSELDSQFRGRLHAFLEMTDLEKGSFAKFKWKNVDPSRDERSNIYKKYPRMRVNGRLRKVTHLALGPPSDGLMTAYEERKESFKAELYDETISALRGEDGEEEDGLSPLDVADEIKEAGVPEKFISIHGGWNKRQIDKDMIEMEYEISGRDAGKVKKLLDNDDEVSIE